MAPIEQLFKKIFDRKCQIESQLKQQRESYAESLVYSLLADGKQPPSWLLESQNELSSKHIAPGISCPLPTPSASEICISEYIHKEHANVATIMGHQKDDQRDCNIICSDVVEDSPVSDSVVRIQCGKSKQQDPDGYFNVTEQIANFGDEVIVEGNARRLTRSVVTPLMSDHSIEPSFTRNLLDLHNKVDDKAASPGLPTECNPHRITRSKQKGSEEYLNRTKQISNFGDEVTVKCNSRRITRSMARSLVPDQAIDQSFTRNSLALHSKVGDKAASSGSYAEHNPCSITTALDSSLMSDHAQDPLVTRNSFGLQNKVADEVSSSRSLDCIRNILQLSSPSETLSANPHNHEEKIHSRSCETSHDLVMVSCGTACTSDSRLKQSARSLMKHTREENCKTMTVDESACSLNPALHDLQIDNSVNTCPESEQTDFAAPAPNLGSRTVANSPLIVHDTGNVTAGRLTSISGSTQPESGVQLKNHSSESRYSLRSLSRNSKGLSYSGPDGTSNITSSKRSRNLTAKVCEISWPKRRKLNCYSDSILATTPRIRLNQFRPAQEGNCCSSKRCLESASFEEIQKISPSRSMLNCAVAKVVTGSHSEELHQRQNQCGREVNSCSQNTDQVSDTSLPNQCTNIFPSLNLADESSTFRTNEICNSGSPLCVLEEPGPSRNDTYDELDCSTTNVDSCNLHTYSSVRYDMEDIHEFMPEFEGFSIGTSPTLENDVYSNSGFPPLSLNVQRSSLISLVTPTTAVIGNYKINKLPDVLHSLPDGFLENVKLNDPLYIHNDYGEQVRTNERAKASLHSSSESAFDFSFMESSYSQSALSSSDSFDWASSKPPLTPPIGKLSSRRVTGKSASSSQKLATNPELVCFRIDEDSTTLEDNECSDELGISGHGTCSKQVKALDDREPLKDVSSRYRNAQNSCPLSKFIAGSTSVQSLDTKFSCATEINVQSSLGSSYTSSMDQMGDIENQCFSVNGDIDRNMAKSLSNRSSEPEINTKKGGRNLSQASIQKGYKPSNIVSNVSSFIPMIKKKQQATTTKGKKEIKVKALEAAEAAKRLEEKRQNEREVRKAAAKLERERLEHEKQLKQKQLEEKRRKEAERLEHEKQLKQKQEEEKRRKESERLEHEKQVKQKQEEEKRRKEAERVEHEKQLKQKQEEEKRRKEAERLEHEKQLKQKQEEEKRRKEAEVAARKRQREEDQKEKDRKRRCNEEARKLQREEDEKLRAKKEEKELRSKAPVDDGKKKGLTQDAKQPLPLKEAAGSRKTNEVETAAAKVAAASADIIKGLIQDRLSTNRENQDFDSYEISPYKDSDDDEDGADESLRRRKKYIPSWARGEPLEKNLLGQQDINPFDIFSRKNSFSLNQVLCPPVARRWPM
ncbi:uncharacterized protein LOC122008874 isoform X1 [Zingiber officinale]|uniref:uncharacterized protein LOC122008874 isoform X1 n=2 Tax=Zingiber officinale TaxID=94328 RepID=UPI001C4BBBA9|nr:uncharacterized protein LOC122008874 isoform X1 [Zingiber officinale]